MQFVLYINQPDKNNPSWAGAGRYNPAFNPHFRYRRLLEHTVIK